MTAVFCGSDNPASLKALRILVTYGIDVLNYIVAEEQNEETKDFCNNNNIRLIDIIPDDLSNFDMLISFSYKRLIPVSLINSAKIAINFHPAPLPYYRGRGTTSFAIINKEKQWASTCHYLAEKFDEGSIVERRWFDITPQLQTGRALSMYSWEICVEMLNDTIEKILEGQTLSGEKQELEGKYYSMKTLQNIKRITIDELQNADELSRKVGALWFPPYEGAYIEVKDKKFFLINEEIFKEISNKYE